MMKVNFERKNIVTLAYRWNYVNRKILKDLEGVNHIHVRHEDLLCATDATISRICNFLNVEFDIRMLSPEVRAKELAESKMLISEHHTNALRKTDPSIAFAHKQKMKSEEKQLIDRYTAHTAALLGYDSDPELYSPSVKHIADRFYGIGFFAYIRLMHNLPLGMKKFLFKNFFSKIFRFWKDAAGSAELRN